MKIFSRISKLCTFYRSIFLSEFKNINNKKKTNFCHKRIKVFIIVVSFAVTFIILTSMYFNIHENHLFPAKVLA